MGPTRREFIRRVVAASFLSVVGAAGLWELLELQPQASQQSPSLIPPPTSSASSQTDASSSQSSSQSATQSRTSSQSQSQSSQSSSTSQSSTQSVPPGYVLITPLSALTGRTSAYFSHPSAGTSILVQVGGSWKAFSASCTHAGCTVQPSGSSLYCPCHAGYFSSSNGSVQSGPPPSPLPEFGVMILDNNLYVTTAAIN